VPLPNRTLVRNRLLRALPPDVYGLVQPRFETVQVRKGDVVVPPGEPFAFAYFPESGLSSVISHTNGARRVEVGAFGFEGMTSTALVLGTDSTPHETLVQVGGTWLRIGADALRQAMKESPPLHNLLMRYVQFFLLTVSQTALANGTHRTEERLARWLLMAHDRLEGDDVPLTHEFLSLMLGVHRPGVTIAIHLLEGARMIKARRGLITVLDRGKLQEAAGDAYGIAETEYERLIGPFRDKPAARDPNG
jgi:CRP-like cAMP-binding protein